MYRIRELRSWGSTGDPHFPLATREDGSWFVLRMNNFPDHNLWTLFRDGEPMGDINDWPVPDLSPRLDSERLPPDEIEDALGLVRGKRVYGSERGEPCEWDCCWRRAELD